jgi:2-polyprenyl-3-methyl-5-hydroxy-6-metoxy-1,4-benzoquinol methylase
VPGCGLGADAEYLARLGFALTALDVSATAIQLAGTATRVLPSST